MWWLLGSSSRAAFAASVGGSPTSLPIAQDPLRNEGKTFSLHVNRFTTVAAFDPAPRAERQCQARELVEAGNKAVVVQQLSERDAPVHTEGGASCGSP